MLKHLHILREYYKFREQPQWFVFVVGQEEFSHFHFHEKL